MQLLTAGLTVAVLGLGAAGCAAAHNAVPPTASSSPTTGSARPPATAVDLSLQRLLVPAPAGFHLSTDPDASVGPLAASDLDGVEGAGSATAFGFAGGYSVTYDQDEGDHSYEYDVFRFTTTAGATAFLTKVVPELVDAGGADKPVRAAVAAIPGAVAIDSTVDDRADGDSFGVVAQRGRVVLLADLATDDVQPAYRDLAEAAALAQYERLAPAA